MCPIWCRSWDSSLRLFVASSSPALFLPWFLRILLSKPTWFSVVPQGIIFFWNVFISYCRLLPFRRVWDFLLCDSILGLNYKTSEEISLLSSSLKENEKKAIIRGKIIIKAVIRFAFSPSAKRLTCDVRTVCAAFLSAKLVSVILPSVAW